jgi:hypothetical protein
MEFGVHTPDQPELFFYGDSRYEIYAAVLTVFDDDNNKKITFGPSGWHRVEEPTDYDITESVHQSVH